VAIELDISDFHYDLPEGLIAQMPAEPRDTSKLMVLRPGGRIEITYFYEILRFLRKGDMLIFNDTKVIPARIPAFKADTGGKVEILLLEERTADDFIQKSHLVRGGAENGSVEQGSVGDAVRATLGEGSLWKCIVKGKNIRPGVRVRLEGGKVKTPEDSLDYMGEIVSSYGEGIFDVLFYKEGCFQEGFPARGTASSSSGRVAVSKEELFRLGTAPLPPYIHSPPDAAKYQTIYAKKEGSAAAPTAGFHFTKELLSEIEHAGIETAFITLHIGTGTFLPVRVKNIKEHRMHSEYFIIEPQEAVKINRAIQEKRRIFVVGTTTLRSLESAVREAKDGKVHPSPDDYLPLNEKEELDYAHFQRYNINHVLNEASKTSSESLDKRGLRSREADGEGELLPTLKTLSASTGIFIRPGFRFRFPFYGLITNFHLPDSTLILLVSALAGRMTILNAYNLAVKERFRFYSYGDAMLILSE